MIEKLRSKPAQFATVAAASGALAVTLVGAYKWRAHEEATPQCTQVQFDTRKGGPGSAYINVYPVIEGTLRPVRNVHGEITDGLNAGHQVRPASDNTHGIIEDYRWQQTNLNVQWSRLVVSGEVDGRTIQCRPQTMTFIPDRAIAGPQKPIASPS